MRLRALSARWLSPFAEEGIHEEDLTPLLGNRSHCSREAPSRICPLLIVRHDMIVLHISRASRLIKEPLPSCTKNGTDSPGGASMRRLLVVIRLIRAALRSRPSLRSHQFAMRLCVDEFCHGMFEGRPFLPWMTMVSCASNPSIPVVQWNTLRGRDPELALWNATLDSDAGRLEKLNASWHLRIPKAVWRGSAAEPFSTNMKWSARRSLQRVPIRIRPGRGQWQRQGRAALLWQAGKHPDLLDVSMRGVQGKDPVLGGNDPEFVRVVGQMARNKPKVSSFIGNVLSLAPTMRARLAT